MNISKEKFKYIKMNNLNDWNGKDILIRKVKNKKTLQTVSHKTTQLLQIEVHQVLKNNDNNNNVNDTDDKNNSDVKFVLGIYASLVIVLEAAGKDETTFRLPSFESIKNINPNTYEYTWRQIETVLIMINAMREQQRLPIQLFEET